MSNSKKQFHPFAYDNEYYLYTEKEKATNEKFESFLTQREASYKESAEDCSSSRKAGDDDHFRDTEKYPDDTESGEESRI